ncbi:MAG: zf-HC2 domain-containing protein [Acidobacteria bacterium]|nr:zf-HC2 domain-containing protein [Acidobacteriota bacterium]
MNSTNKNQLACGRKEDLVTYLYGEATAAERVSFERHLNECDDCGAELNAFGSVRDDLSTWQVGFAPRTEFVPPKTRLDVVRELIGMFPVWARGLAMTGVAAAVVLMALSGFGTRPGISNSAGLSEQQVQEIVSKAVADERAKIQQQYQAELASFKTQLVAEHQAQLQLVTAEHQAKLETVKAGLRAEIKKANQQNGSLRSFFAIEDDRSYPWGDSR